MLRVVTIDGGGRSVHGFYTDLATDRGIYFMSWVKTPSLKRVISPRRCQLVIQITACSHLSFYTYNRTRIQSRVCIHIYRQTIAS